ncbi:MAG TPA: hypothetical protein VJ385_05275, partial [Fibrobacteria bacterium]|nr:hypothetical protein [Fibrobacteria bacterium]
MRPALREYPDLRERGSALVGAVVFLMILSTLGLAYLGFPANEAREVEQSYKDLKIRWAAEEALSQGLARANRVAQPRDTILTAIDGGDYPARFRIRRLDDSRFPRYLVSAMVYDGNLAFPPLCSLSVVVQAGTAISEHFLIEDNAGGKFYFTGDTIDGPVHSNTRFAIAGSPIFTDPVFEMGDVKDGFILHPEFTATPKLASGKPQGGEKYRFDNMSSLIRNVPPAQKIRPDPGLVLSITFKGPLMELSYRDRTVKDVYSTPITRAIPKEGGLFVDGEVEVKGTLSKSLTLGASGDIVITGDLAYSGSDPITAKPKETSPVHLGLISEKNVLVHQVQTREEAGTGIRINASIVAMDKSFEVTNMQAHSWDMGTMHFWGTIAQVERGGIGALKVRDLFRGYHKDWHF